MTDTPPQATEYQSCNSQTLEYLPVAAAQQCKRASVEIAI